MRRSKPAGAWMLSIRTGAAVVAEAVLDAGRDEHERARRRRHALRAEDERQLAVEDVEGVVLVGVDVGVELAPRRQLDDPDVEPGRVGGPGEELDVPHPGALTARTTIGRGSTRRMLPHAGARSSPRTAAGGRGLALAALELERDLQPLVDAALRMGGPRRSAPRATVAQAVRHDPGPSREDLGANPLRGPRRVRPAAPGRRRLRAGLTRHDAHDDLLGRDVRQGLGAPPGPAGPYETMRQRRAGCALRDVPGGPRGSRSFDARPPAPPASELASTTRSSSQRARGTTAPMSGAAARSTTSRARGVRRAHLPRLCQRRDPAFSLRHRAQRDARELVAASRSRSARARRRRRPRPPRGRSSETPRERQPERPGGVGDQAQVLVRRPEPSNVHGTSSVRTLGESGVARAAPRCARRSPC